MKPRYSREIKSNKLELTNPEIFKWYQEVIATLEKDSSIPVHKKISTLKEVFSASILNKMLSKITVVDHPKGWNICPSSPSESTTSEEHTSLNGTNVSIFSSLTSKIKSGRVSKDKPSKLSAGVKVHAKGKKCYHGSSCSSASLKKLLNYKGKIKKSPYVSFFKKSNVQAAIWREIADNLPKALTIEEKVDLISDKIAKGYINWLQQAGFVDDTFLTAEEIKEMFEITSQSSSIDVIQTELHSIPSVTSHRLGMPHRSKKWILAEQVLKDKDAFEGPLAINVGFGKHVPHQLKKRKSTSEDYKKWLIQKVPEKLETMETVWENITDLEITQQYTEFMLKEYPEVPPPIYLVKSGLASYSNVEQQICYKSLFSDNAEKKDKRGISFQDGDMEIKQKY